MPFVCDQCISVEDTLCQGYAKSSSLKQNPNLARMIKKRSAKNEIIRKACWGFKDCTFRFVLFINKISKCDFGRQKIKVHQNTAALPGFL